MKRINYFYRFSLLLLATFFILNTVPNTASVVLAAPGPGDSQQINSYGGIGIQSVNGQNTNSIPTVPSGSIVTVEGVADGGASSDYVTNYCIGRGGHDIGYWYYNSYSLPLVDSTSFVRDAGEQSSSTNLTEVQTGQDNYPCEFDPNYQTPFIPYEYTFVYSFNTAGLSAGRHTTTITTIGISGQPLTSNAQYDIVDSSFSCFIQTQSQTIAKGSSGTYTVQVTGSSSVTGATTLTLDNPPAGVSSSGATATIPTSAPYQATAGLPVAVDSSAATGSTNIAITATNGSQTKQCGSAQLDITESRDFSLAVSPAAQAAQAPNSLDYSVHAYCSGGFSAPIQFISVNHSFTNVTTAFYLDSSGSNPIDRVACGQTVILRLTATAQSWPLNSAMPVSITGKEVPSITGK